MDTLIRKIPIFSSGNMSYRYQYRPLLLSSHRLRKSPQRKPRLGHLQGLRWQGSDRVLLSTHGFLVPSLYEDSSCSTFSLSSDQHILAHCDSAHCRLATWLEWPLGDILHPCKPVLMAHLCHTWRAGLWEAWWSTGLCLPPVLHCLDVI